MTSREILKTITSPKVQNFYHGTFNNGLLYNTSLAYFFEVKWGPYLHKLQFVDIEELESANSILLIPEVLYKTCMKDFEERKREKIDLVCIDWKEKFLAKE